MTENLPFHEWLIILLLVCMMTILSVVTYIKEDTFTPLTESGHALFSNEIRVYINGAVSKPGWHVLKKISTLKDLLVLAEPLPDADLTKFKVSARLKHEKHIYVPAIDKITIYLEGAVVNPGYLQIPKGTTTQELTQYVEFQKDANLKIIKQKRRLKDEELIYIPGNT